MIVYIDEYNNRINMSKANPLAGLIANYGDSDDSDDEMVHASYSVSNKKINKGAASTGQDPTTNVAGIHPAPIPHCPWSACYDESSGFTYYWNQRTNAVTWEAPPEYLLALKIAQQQLHTSGSAEVSAEEWQLYQQALAEKQNSQNKIIAKAAITKCANKIEKPSPSIKEKKTRGSKKRPTSDDEDEKIELITSYHNSDSESNEEAESPAAKVKSVTVPQKAPVRVQNNVHKKQKTKVQLVEYGPSMPPNMNYSVPIGPELPANMDTKMEPKTIPNKINTTEKEDKRPSVSIDNEDNQDEVSLLKKLKDKAKLLEKLGGELPSDLQQIIKDDTNLSATDSLGSTDDMNKKNIDIDDMLEQIEKTEFLKAKSKSYNKDTKSSAGSVSNSPRSDGHRTPPLEELKTLFPSGNISHDPIPTLFPSVINFEETSNSSKPASPQPKPAPEKKENMYLMDVNEPIENVSRKKLRISNSVLPERKVEKSETPAYTTKYSQYIEGFSDQRTGLGFKEEEKCDSPRNTVSYGNGLTFTKGETLNEGKKDEELRDLTDLIGAKLKYLNELQPCVLTPVQEMLIQLQTLVRGWGEGGVCARYLRRWADAAGAALARHETDAAPPGWTCTFQRCEGRYRYRREADGLQQWEYPARDDTDMDISTTPPHAASDAKEDVAPPLPSTAAPLPAAPSPPSPPPMERVATPPPPRWHEPPPPGCDDPLPLPADTKGEICEELMCFYNDIAELEKQSEPSTAASSPEPAADARDRAKDRDAKAGKKKSKVKISTSMGLKHKSVSSLVAKWQQVADEIHSD